MEWPLKHKLFHLQRNEALFIFQINQEKQSKKKNNKSRLDWCILLNLLDCGMCDKLNSVITHHHTSNDKCHINPIQIAASTVCKGTLSSKKLRRLHSLHMHSYFVCFYERGKRQQTIRILPFPLKATCCELLVILKCFCGLRTTNSCGVRYILSIKKWEVTIYFL